MRILPLVLGALLLAGCLEPRAAEEPTREAIDEAAAPDQTEDLRPTTPTPPGPPPSEAFGFVVNVIPPTAEEPWAFVTVGSASASGARSAVRGGLNVTVILLGWDVTTRTYADVYELDAALQSENHTLGYLRTSFRGAGATAEFNVPSAVANRSGDFVPVRSLVVASPQSDGFLAVTLPDGGIYEQGAYTVIEDGRAQTVTAWGRQDYGVLDAAHAERAGSDDAADGEGQPE